MNKQSKKVSVPQKEEELKCRGTFLINTNYMLYKMSDDLDVCTPNKQYLKYRGTFILFIYSMLRDKKRKSRKRTPKIKEIHILGYLDHGHIQYVAL